MFRAVRQLLFTLPPERAHAIAFAGLDLAARLHLAGYIGDRVEDPREVMGITFRNAVGLAAGLDKDGEHIAGLAAAGFGFLELGTVTPRPQPGNPRPRLFRLPSHDALINRLGFNNQGVEHLIERVARADVDVPLGINIGKNRDTPLEAALDDYLHCLDAVYALADYVVVNLSSPNTPGLRSLQAARELTDLIRPLLARRDELAAASDRRVPVLVKIAPDLADDDLSATVDALMECGIDGITATNTTLARDAVAGHRHANEAGGLSGRPLTERATAVVQRVREQAGPQLPIIAVGGIMSAADAVEKMQAGANLIQLYTGFIYHGPPLIAESARAIRASGR